MSVLPEGFVLDAPAAPPAGGLPAGFVLDGPARPGASPGIADTLAAAANPEADPDALAGGASLVKGALRGARDVVDGGAQLLARGLEAIVPANSALGRLALANRQNTEAVNNAAETDYQQNWRDPRLAAAPDPGRFAGNTAMTGPLVAALMPAAPGILGGIATGAAGGAIGSALKPVDADKNPDYWSTKAKDVAAGAATGALTGGAFGALGRVVSPKASTNPDVQALMDAGVTPTPGQILGGRAAQFEEKLGSVPVVGGMVQNARARAMEDFNRAAINKALEPIGEALDKGTPVGREAIGQAIDTVNGAYARLLPSLTVKVDQTFAQGLGSLATMARDLPADRAAQFGKILENQVLGKFNPQTGIMTGETMKSVESELGRLASSYRNSPVGDERLLGSAIQELQSTLRGLVQRSNPEAAGTLAATNQAYATLLRVQDAAAKVGSPNGAFTPAALTSSVKKFDSSFRDRAFARGDALLQDFAEAGKNVLGNKVPDSGTAGRMLVGGGIPAAAMYAYNNPLAAGAIGAGAGLGMLPYTAAGQRLAAGLLASREPGAGLLSEAIRSAGPLAAGAVGAVTPGLLTR
jgi:hypothetical protein